MATIVTKNSSTASAVPTTSDLVQGELAVNVTDKRIFTENASTQIVELGTNPSTITTGTATVTGTLTANGTFASNNAVITGGSINSTPIGATTPSTVRGTTVTATTGFVGGLTGNVVGNVTGNVTGNVVGNVTGDLTGNVTASSGTSTVNNLVVNGTVDFTNTRLTDVAEPIAGSDAATKTYVDTSIAAVIDGAPAALDTLNELAAALNDDASFHTSVTNSLAGKLSLTGGTMTGQLSLGANKIVSVADPTLAQDVATKAYVDAADSTGLPLSGGTMSGAIAMGTNKITGLGTPTDAADATTKAYTDSILGSATSAADSAAAAATSASNASTSASNAASSATAASTSETNAALSATNAAASYDSFDDRYLGAKASDPTVDNDGDALIEGATYFNTTSDSMKVYSGSAWSDVAPVATSVTLSQVTDFPSQTGQSGKYLSTNGTVPSWVALTTDPTLGTLTKTFANGESASISLTSSVLAPVVSVTKEVPQSGVTNNSWDVNSTTENYTRLDSAYATTLNWAGFDVSTASFVDSFSVAAQDLEPTGVTFNTDGTRMFVVGEASDNVNQYSLSTGFDVSTASFSASFSLSSQQTQPKGLTFNSDGTKMYIVGSDGTNIDEYNLGTAFTVTTSVYSQSFSVSAQDTNPTGIVFNNDGTKMYIVGDTGDDINQYALTTGFDISTASFTQSFSVSAQETSPEDVAFNSNGTKMFVVGRGTNAVKEYNLSTAFDISTSVFSQSFDVSAQETQSFGIAFNTNGTKMFIVGRTGDDVNEYSLSERLTLGTGSFASADVGKTIEANSGAFVLTATDGSYVETTAPTSYAQVASGSWSMYGVVYNATDGDLELSGILLNGFDVSTASFIDSFSVAAQDSVPHGMAFNTDGTKMFIVGYNGNSIYEYTLSTAFDVSTATFIDGVSVATGPVGLAFNADGTKMYVVGLVGKSVNEYSLSTGFDVSTASYSQAFSVSTQDDSPRDITFNTDGTKMFLVGLAGQDINEYTLSTAFNVSTATFVDSFSVASQEVSPQGVEFNNNGTSMFVIGNNADSVNEYTLSTGFDVSTASFVDSFSVSAQETESRGLAFNTTGTKMFVIGLNGDDVNEYSVGTLLTTTGYQPVHTTASTDTTYWTDINSMTADQNAGDGNVYYAISTDDRTTWTVIDNTDGERDIVRNNAGTWQYNSNSTYASETWVNGTTNTELATLAEAMAEEVGYLISNASYDSVSFNASSQETSIYGLAFNADGTALYTLGYGNDTVYQYTLSTAYDISTASYASKSFSVASQDAVPVKVSFNTTGTKMYVLGSTNDSVFQYSLSTGFDVSTASYDSVSFSVASQESSPAGMVFNNDGTKMFIIGSASDAVYQYSLSTAFDLSTASYASISFSVSAQATSSTQVLFNSDGTKMFVLDNANPDGIYQYSLSTAFNVSTASYDSVSFDVTAQTTAGGGMVFNGDGTKLLLASFSDGTVYQYSSTASQARTVNQMDKTQLDAVTDPNHIALGNDLDLAIVFNMTSGSTVPSSDGVAINYDANVLNKGAVLGTDYDFDAPTQNSVRITALAANNLKVRVV